VEHVLKNRIPDIMPIQKSVVYRPESQGGGVEDRYWSPVSSAVIGSDGSIEYIIHHVEDVTDFILLKRERAEELQASEKLRTHTGELETKLFLQAQELDGANRNLRVSNEKLAELYQKSKEIDMLNTQLHELVEAVPEAIIEVDERGRIVLVNQAALGMFGYSREEFLTLDLEALVPAAQRSVHIQHRIRYMTKPTTRLMARDLELSAQRKDGSLFPAEISLSPNFSSGSFKTIASVRDISERRRAEAEVEAHRAKLASSARLVALGMMAGGVAHEINNPLAIIHASASDLLQTAREEVSVPPEIVVQNADRVLQTANRISKIVKSMRSLSREGSQDPLRPTPVARIVEETLEICKENFRVHSVRLFLPSIDPTLQVSCREVQIAQVLLNLLQNAYDAVMDQATDRWVGLNVEVDDESVLFSVSDSGPGVPPELKTRIMEPFFTTKDVGKGTGLGLSLSQKILEEHGAHLLLTERAGHTCFCFRLPLSKYAEAICN
jgi:PAS domain S-box-containing protein